MDILTALAARLLALSLVTERAITTFKTLIPLLAEPSNAHLLPINRPQDRIRRFTVQVLAFAVAWAAAATLSGGNWWSGVVGDVPIGSTPSPALPTWTFGLLATGGSAFWSNLLGIATATKDLRLQQRTANGLTAQGAVGRQAAIERSSAITAQQTPPLF